MKKLKKKEKRNGAPKEGKKEENIERGREREGERERETHTQTKNQAIKNLTSKENSYESISIKMSWQTFKIFKRNII